MKIIEIVKGSVKNKITLSTDPSYYGADTNGYKATGPVVNIPADQLVGFEPDDKMTQPASKTNVEKIVAALKQGAPLPPLLVRRYKNGYQVLDGHHRFWAYKLLKTKNIPAQIVPPEDIEEISQKKMADWIIMPQTIKPQGLIHKNGHGPNNRFGFRNVGNNRANENITADHLKQLQAEYAPFKDKALPAVKGHELRQYLKSLSDQDLILLTKTDIPHVSSKAHIMLDLHRYSRMRDPISSPLDSVEENFADVKPKETERNLKKLHLINSVNEKVDWQALRNAGVVMPMLYYPGGKDPKTGRIIPPSVNQPNIITAVNLTQKSGPGEKLTPLKDTEVTPQFWQQYMDQMWPTLQPFKKDQIRQSAKMKGIEFNENFADGRGPGRAGDSKRAGIPKGATITQLKRIRSSKTASPRKKQLAHWQINMRQGRKRNK